MSVSITTARLAELAKTPDRELRIEQQGNQNELQSPEGTWGGRLVRSLKIAVDWDGRATDQVKQDKYKDAGDAVHDALVKTYGQDIADKAFKAGIGHETNGQWGHSWNHPITGRHIQKMLSTAQKELKAEDPYRQVELPRAPFKLPTGETITRAPTLMWFQQSATQGQSPDRAFWQGENLRNDLLRLEHRGQSGVPGFEERGFVVRSPLPEVATEHSYERGLGLGDAIAQQLRTDADTRRNNQPNSAQDFWQLDVRWPEATQSSAIGIRIDRNDPDTVHVFDAKTGEFSVPRDNLAGFLGQHLKEFHGDISAHTLCRVDQAPLSGAFTTYRQGEPTQTTIRADQLSQPKQDKFDHLVNHDGTVPGPHGVPLSQQFTLDVGRMHITAQTGPNGNVEHRKLSNENCDTILGNLLPDVLEKPTRELAITNLSRLISQGPFNAMQEAFHGSLRNDELAVLDPKGLPSVRNVELRSCEMQNGRPGVEISLDTTTPLTGYTEMTNMGPELRSLSPDRDFMQSRMTVRVSIDDLIEQPDLQNANLVPRFTISSQAIREYHIEQPPPKQDPRPLSFQTTDDGKVSVGDAGDIIPHTRMAELREHMSEQLKDHRELTLESGHQVSDTVFHSMHQATVTLAFDDAPPRPLRQSDAIGEQLARYGLTKEGVTEVSKLFDRSLLDHALCDTARSLSMTGDELQEFMNRSRPLEVRLNRRPDGAIDVTLSTDVTRWLENPRIAGNLDGLPETDGKLNLSLTIRLDVKHGDVRRELIGAPRLDFSQPPRLAPDYELRGGVIDKRLTLDEPNKQTLRNRITADLSLANNPQCQLHPEFTKDTARMQMTIDTADQSKLLTPEIGEAALRELVGGDGPEQDRAVARLSQLLHMSSAASIFAPTLKRFATDTGLILQSDSGDIRITRQNDMLELTYSSGKPLAQIRANEGELHGTTPLTDYYHTTGSIRVSLAELRGGEEPQFEVTRYPETMLHIEGYRGILDDDAPGDPLARPETAKTSYQDGIRSVDIASRRPDQGARIRAMQDTVRTHKMITVGDAALAESAWSMLRSRELGRRYPDEENEINGSLERAQDQRAQLVDLVGSPQQAEQLSRLLNETFIQDAYREAMLELGALETDLQNHTTPGRVAIDIQPTKDSDESLDITFTRASDDLHTCEGMQPFLEREGLNTGEHKLDVTMTLRVRRQDLIEGHPERFELVHGARLEVRAEEI